MPEVKIFPVSDIHLEFLEQDFNFMKAWPEADILVLAGDIGNPTKENYQLFLKICKEKYKDVVMVAGNHEFYGCNYERNSAILLIENICKILGIHFLHRNSALIQGINFIGVTLWSVITQDAEYVINDFNMGVFKHRLDYITEFCKDYTYLKETLENLTRMRNIVITHHLPTFRLCHPRFHKNVANTAFYTEVTDAVPLSRITYWFCGHTHEYAKIIESGCVIVVNPIGYPNENKRTKISYQTYQI